MDFGTDSEDMDIALFSKKFKQSQEKLTRSKKNIKNDASRMNPKPKIRSSANEKKVEGKYNEYSKRQLEDAVLRSSKVEYDEKEDYSVKKVWLKPQKRKQSAESNSEPTVVPLKKKKTNTAKSSDVNITLVRDELAKEKYLSQERTQKIKQKNLKDSSENTSTELQKSEMESHKLQYCVGTSSDESELETDKRNSSNTKAKQKVITKRKRKMQSENMAVNRKLSDKTVLQAGDSLSGVDSSESETNSDNNAGFKMLSPHESLDRTTEYSVNKTSDKLKQEHAENKKFDSCVRSNFEKPKTDSKKPIKAISESSDAASDSDDSESDNANSDSETEFVSGSITPLPNEKIDKKGQQKLKKDTDLIRKKRSTELEAEQGSLGDDSNVAEEDDQYAAIKKELADIPLEDLMKIKDKLGLKVFSKIMQGGKSEDTKKAKVFKRENKNRPMEMSSKKPVPILRQAHAPKKKVSRDPRFDDLSGEYKEEYFERNYSFLQDVKAKEREVVKKKLKKSKNEEKKQKLQYLLNRMNQQEQAAQHKQKRREIEMSLKQKEKELIKEGKTPYFLKKAERKKLELAERYKELQKSGKIDQYLSRKRRKNAQKEKKKLPGKHTRF